MSIISIDGIKYDVTDFISNHPGGNVIKYYVNIKDASIAFRNFHTHSEEAMRILHTLQVHPKKQEFRNLYTAIESILVFGTLIFILFYCYQYDSEIIN